MASLTQRLAALWGERRLRMRTGWRWLGYALTLAAIGYVVSIFLVGGFPLSDVPWEHYFAAVLVSLFFYLLSLLIQFLIWSRVLSGYRSPDWRDVEIYARMILARRLPGGIWHWVGRVAMYSASTDIPAHVLVLANFLEWILLILVAAGLVLAGLSDSAIGMRLLSAGAAFGLAIGIAVSWQSRGRPWLWRLMESCFWALLYAVCWYLGGLILYSLIQASGQAHISLLEATRLWALAGGVSIAVTILPGVFGIQELTLTLLLQSYVPQPIALLLSLLLRLVFTLADILWGLLGWLTSYIALRGPGRLGERTRLRTQEGRTRSPSEL